MSALASLLDSLPLATALAVTNDAGTHLVVKVGRRHWVQPSDGVTLHTLDLLDGRPSSVEVVEDDGHLPPDQEIEEAREELARARAAVERVSRQMEDLASVGFTGAVALRDEALAMLGEGR